MESELKFTKSFGEVEQEMTGRGFRYVGQESLTTTKFSGDARFIAQPQQTREDVIAKYSEGGKFEIELINTPNKSEGQESVWVFTKEKD